MSQVAFSVRMDSELKEKFEKLCDDLGMNMTTAFNIFARTVVREQGIPFEVSAVKTAAKKYEPMVLPNMVADSLAVYSAVQNQKRSKELQHSWAVVYKNALEKWREESKFLFDNPDDAEFMEHAFERTSEKEPYKEKEIW